LRILTMYKTNILTQPKRKRTTHDFSMEVCARS
jgi:hypothetical protein